MRMCALVCSVLCTVSVAAEVSAREIEAAPTACSSGNLQESRLVRRLSSPVVQQHLKERLGKELVDAIISSVGASAARAISDDLGDLADVFNRISDVLLVLEAIDLLLVDEPLLEVNQEVLSRAFPSSAPIKIDEQSPRQVLGRFLASLDSDIKERGPKLIHRFSRVDPQTLDVHLVPNGNERVVLRINAAEQSVRYSAWTSLDGAEWNMLEISPEVYESYLRHMDLMPLVTSVVGSQGATGIAEALIHSIEYRELYDADTHPMNRANESRKRAMPRDRARDVAIEAGVVPQDKVVRESHIAGASVGVYTADRSRCVWFHIHTESVRQYNEEGDLVGYADGGLVYHVDLGRNRLRRVEKTRSAMDRSQFFALLSQAGLTEEMYKAVAETGNRAFMVRVGVPRQYHEHGRLSTYHAFSKITAIERHPDSTSIERDSESGAVRISQANSDWTIVAHEDRIGKYLYVELIVEPAGGWRKVEWIDPLRLRRALLAAGLWPEFVQEVRSDNRSLLSWFPTVLQSKYGELLYVAEHGIVGSQESSAKRLVFEVDDEMYAAPASHVAKQSEHISAFRVRYVEPVQVSDSHATEMPQQLLEWEGAKVAIIHNLETGETRRAILDWMNRELEPLTVASFVEIAGLFGVEDLVRRAVDEKQVHPAVAEEWERVLAEL